MKRILRYCCTATIILSLISSALIIVSASFLYKYSKSRIDESLIAATHSYGKTTLYAYNSSSQNDHKGTLSFDEYSTIDTGINHKYVTYDKLSADLINAFVAIEDKRFFEHNGIDYLRSIKAVFNYLLGGTSSFGGSTITQQLVKNLTGNDDISVSRKMSEAFCALDLEEKYDKSEIMEMYLNIINLSNGCRGVGAASEYFFSKDVDKLTLCEVATIAAITNNPSKYDPVRHSENTRQRRDTVLLCMYNQGYIDENEYKNSINQPIMLDINKHYSPDHINSWYTDMVIEDVTNDLAKKYNISKRSASYLLLSGGYKIYTPVNVSIQSILDEYYSDKCNFASPLTDKHPQSSMIVIDPYSGDILGIAGAVGIKTANRIQNYATNTLRPPGSSIKPLSVYAPALENGIIEWSTLIEDSPITAESEYSSPWPMNANKKYIGSVNIKYAIENSLNTVPVKLLKKLGNENSFDFLNKKLLIHSLNRSTDMGDASLALGQPSYGISLRELVSAYSIFQEGIMSRSRSYYKVTDSHGNIILDNFSEQIPVISRENASIMTKLLQNVVSNGTASGMIRLSEKTEVAGKTGTTQYNNDKYFVGYTPELLAGVWLGYEYPEPLNGFGGNFSAIIWDDIMSRIYSKSNYSKSKKNFYVPDTVQLLTYDKKTGEFPDDTCDPNDIEIGWFVCNN